MVIIQRLDYSLRGSISHLFQNFILYILKYHNNEDEYDELQSPMSSVFIVHLKAHPSPPSMDSLLMNCGILSLSAPCRDRSYYPGRLCRGGLRRRRQRQSVC